MAQSTKTGRPKAAGEPGSAVSFLAGEVINKY